MTVYLVVNQKTPSTLSVWAIDRHHEIFDQKNAYSALNCIVVSYPTLHTRNGPSACKKFARDVWGYSEAQAEMQMFFYPADQNDPTWSAPFDLRNCFEEIVLDEAQNTKGMQSHSTFTIRSLEAPWTTIVTATPIPYSANDFSGLLSFVQSPYDNDVARKRLQGIKGYDPLLDPYAIDSEGRLLRPQDKRFMFTASAFEFYCFKLPPDEQGRRLALIWKELMIRRDYSSSCVIDHIG